MKDKNIIKFENTGYFEIKNFFSRELISKLNDEISKAQNVDKYFDRDNKLRRIERLYDKGVILKKNK